MKPLDMLSLTSFFDEGSFKRGIQYFQQGKVSQLDVRPDGRLMTANVQGSGARQRYQTLVHLTVENGKLTHVDGQCTCPVGYNCKHVVAVLLTHMSNDIQVQSNVDSPQRHQRDNGHRDTQRWLDNLKASQSHTVKTSAFSADQLHYVLSTTLDRMGHQLMVQTWRTRPLQKGGWGKGQLVRHAQDSTAAYVTDQDRQLNLFIKTLARDFYASDKWPIVGEFGEYVLRQIIATERCHWQTVQSPVLQLADTRTEPLAWHMQNQQATFGLPASSDLILLPLPTPWYVDVAHHAIGSLQTDTTAEINQLLFQAPPVSLKDFSLVNQTLTQHYEAKNAVPLLPDLASGAIDTKLKPVPYLRLYSRIEDHLPAMLESPEPIWEDLADMTFQYGDHRVHPLNSEAVIVVQSGEEIQRIQRHHKQEEAYADQAFEAGLEIDVLLQQEKSANDPFLTLFHYDHEDGWVDFWMQQLPQLQQQGWIIEVDPSFRHRIVTPNAWYADLDERANNQWFDLELGIEMDGETLNLLPILVNFIQQLRHKKSLDQLKDSEQAHLLVPLPDGRTLALAFDKIRHIINVLVELYDPNVLTDQNQLRLSRYQATQLNALAQTDLTWGGAAGPKRFAEQLADFSGIQKIKPPKNLNAKLRPYQKHGLNWLQFLREYDLSGILADDMGLGKTVQTLAHLLVEKNSDRLQQPSLVVAPTSLMVNWAREAEKFAPSLNVCVLQGSERKQYFDRLAEFDVVLSTYPLLPRDEDILLKQSWHFLVLDEAQHIKNPHSKVSQTACQLKANHRLCLTGTPIENHLGELWSQFHFLMPGLLGNDRQFNQLFRKPIENQGDGERQKQLNQRLKPFILRREKSQVVTELPEKTEIVSNVVLSGKQRQLYETVRVAMHDKVKQAIDNKGIERSQIIILDALLKLRQICCDPRLLKMDAAKNIKQSAKLEQLMEVLPEMIAEGRRVLLFSQFTSMLSLIEKELKKHKIDYVKLTGQTKDRATPVDRFQQQQVPLFLISLKAGGAGLNLTAADTVIHYDPWWNPAAERQATDRAHRIGQKNKVFVYKFITEGTVEEKIHQMQQKKQALADALFDDKKSAAKLNANDLQSLFEPLL